MPKSTASTRKKSGGRTSSKASAAALLTKTRTKQLRQEKLQLGPKKDLKPPPTTNLTIDTQLDPPPPSLELLSDKRPATESPTTSLTTTPTPTHKKNKNNTLDSPEPEPAPLTPTTTESILSDTEDTIMETADINDTKPAATTTTAISTITEDSAIDLDTSPIDTPPTASLNNLYDSPKTTTTTSNIPFNQTLLSSNNALNKLKYTTTSHQALAILKSNTAANSLKIPPPKVTLIRIEAKATISGLNQTERQDNHRNILDLIISTSKSLNITAFLVPIFDLKGKRVPRMGNTPTAKFAINNDQPADSRPNLGVYSNDWASKKESSYSFSIFYVNVEVEGTAVNWFGKVFLPLKNTHNIEIKPRRFQYKPEDEERNDAIAVAILHPSVSIMEADLTTMSLIDLHGLQINFVPAAQNQNGQWIQLNFRHDGIIGMIAIAHQDSGILARKIIAKEYPVKSKNKTTDYPNRSKFVAFPFNSTGIHPTITDQSKYSNLTDVLKQDYLHSRRKPSEGGGRITKKLAANSLSLSLLINTLDGDTTTLRNIIMTQTVDIKGSKKPMFSYVGTIPTRGNVNSVLTGFISRRSGSQERTTSTAEQAYTWVHTRLAQYLWNLLGHDEASLVLAPVLLQSVGLEAYPDEEDEEEDDNELAMPFEILLANDDEVSKNSVWGNQSTTTNKTTQSTRDKLVAAETTQAETEQALQDQAAELKLTEDARKAEQSEREKAEDNLAAQMIILQQQTEAHNKIVEALRRQLEGTSTADVGQTEHQQNINLDIDIASVAPPSNSQGGGITIVDSSDETDTASHSTPTEAAVASG